MSTRFPNDFRWGAATAAYQVEGAATEGGRGPSIWDVYCRKEGAVLGGHSGDVACDHYHRYRGDVALMKELGISMYRCSISWPRVLPEGTGTVNEVGFDFYDRLVDELLGAGIEPWVTLYHWDLPYALYQRGGWLSPDSPRWFADYAALLGRRLGDRVGHWFTFNEPQAFIGVGYQLGFHAPGLQLSRAEVAGAAYNVLLAHGQAVSSLRSASPRAVEVGYVPSAGGFEYPSTNEPSLVEAVRKSNFTFTEAKSRTSFAWWYDPVCRGTFSPEVRTYIDRYLPGARPDDDLATIGRPLDFLAFNLYHGKPMAFAPDGSLVQVAPPVGAPETLHAWPVTPPALGWAARYLWEAYRLPIYVGENGLSCMDWVAVDGAVHDPQRIDFHARYLGALAAAIETGADVRGYFAWSFMDNFEWAKGYTQRFGLVHVDFETLERTPKDSFPWYQRVIASNGAGL